MLDVVAMNGAGHAAILSAYAEWALALITFLGVVVGALAAFSALKSLRLESEPVIVIKGGEANQYLRSVDSFTMPGTISVYVVTGNPTLAQGIVLRLHAPSDDRQEDISVTGERKNWPTLTLQFENVGRSPAIGVEIDFDLSMPMLQLENVGRSPVIGVEFNFGLSTPMSAKPGQLIPDLEPEADPQTGGFVMVRGRSRGFGTIRFDAIPARTLETVTIENRVGLLVALTARHVGRQIRWSERRRRAAKIAVVSPSGSFLIEAAGTTT
jgi:hypothetical protein